MMRSLLSRLDVGEMAQFRSIVHVRNHTRERARARVCVLIALKLLNLVMKSYVGNESENKQNRGAKEFAKIMAVEWAPYLIAQRNHARAARARVCARTDTWSELFEKNKRVLVLAVRRYIMSYEQFFEVNALLCTARVNALSRFHAAMFCTRSSVATKWQSQQHR
jgi:hypothetical protein